jgi:lysophospholipase L1-like esterase
MRRFAVENEVRKPDVIIIDIGTNDSSYLKSKSENYVPLTRFENNLVELIGQAKKITQEIIFVGLTAVEESKTSPVPWETDFSYTNENIAIYNAKIKEICAKNNLLFIEMKDLLKNEDLEDGLHPNSNGHEKMFLRVKDFLEKNKII